MRLSAWMAMARGGTTTAAPGQRAATSREALAQSQAPSAVTESTGPAKSVETPHQHAGTRPGELIDEADKLIAAFGLPSEA